MDEVASKLKDAGFKFGFEPIRVKFTPTQGVRINICFYSLPTETKNAINV